MRTTVWIACGIAWAFRSVLELYAPEYYDPVSTIDYAAVFGYTAALILSGPAVLLLARLARSTPTLIAATTVAIAAIVAGVANTLEDALDVGWMTWVYLGAILALVAASIALTVTLAVERRFRLAAVLAVLTIGICTAFTVLLGGLLILGAFVAVSAKPTWFGEALIASPRAP